MYLEGESAKIGRVGLPLVLAAFVITSDGPRLGTLARRAGLAALVFAASALALVGGASAGAAAATWPALSGESIR